jgi:hypothetical protein
MRENVNRYELGSMPETQVMGVHHHSLGNWDMYCHVLQGDWSL